jgi:hypothetical protein
VVDIKDFYSDPSPCGVFEPIIFSSESNKPPRSNMHEVINQPRREPLLIMARILQEGEYEVCSGPLAKANDEKAVDTKWRLLKNIYRGNHRNNKEILLVDLSWRGF